VYHGSLHVERLLFDLPPNPYVVRFRQVGVGHDATNQAMRRRRAATKEKHTFSEKRHAGADWLRGAALSNKLASS